MDFDSNFVEKGYMKKSWKLRVLGPAVDIGKSIAKEIEMIEQMVVKISLLQDSCKKK